jgi:putative ABC transport system permease protein
MRVRFWLRWAGRDLRARLALVLALAMVLAIGAGLFATLGAMKQWRVASADASFAALKAHDIRLVLDEGSYAPAGRMRAAAESVSDVAVARERLGVPVQLSLSPGGRTVLTAGRLVGMDPGPAEVDALAAHRGRALAKRDDGRPVAVVERAYGTYHELPAKGAVDVSGRRLRYVGHVMAPEWFVVAREGTVWGAEATFGVVFTSLRTAQQTAGRQGVVNEVVVRLGPGADVTAAKRHLVAAFGARLPRFGVTATTLAEENAHRFLYRDAENDQRVFLVFALLILGGAALAAFNLVSRVVDAQRRGIGIGMALGVSPLKLALRPMLLGLQVGVLGAGLGIGVALGTAALFQPLLAEMLPLPEIRTPFQAGAFVLGAALGLVIPLAAAALPVWRSVRVAPIEAIRMGFRAARGAGLARVAARLRVPGRSLAQLPLRNALRAPRRTVTTALGVAAVISVVVALGGMTDSFDATVGRAAAEVERVTPGRVVVTLDGFRPVDSPAVRALAADRTVADAEPALTVQASIMNGGRSVDVAFQVSDPASKLWRPSVETGRHPGAGAGVLLSRRAAEELGVGPGDTVDVRHPVRGGHDALASATSSAVVTGVHGNPFRQVAVAGEAWADRMRLTGLANSMSVEPAPGASPLQVRRALSAVPGVASVEEAAAATRTLQEAMGQFAGVLRIGWAFALALALLMAFNATTINADERRREHATMFAFGVVPWRVLTSQVLENMLVGLLATVAGIALGHAILDWIVGSLIPETFPDLGIEIAVASGTLAAAGVAGILALAAAPLLTARRMRRMDVPATLRVME